MKTQKEILKKELSNLIEKMQDFIPYDDIEKELVSYLDNKTIVKNNKIII